MRAVGGFKRLALTPVLGRLEDEVVERVANLGLSVHSTRAVSKRLGIKGTRCGNLRAVRTLEPAYASGKSVNARESA